MAKLLEIVIDKEKDIVLFTGSTFLIKDDIKALPGARWNGKDKVWFAPLSKNKISDLKIQFPGSVIVGLDGGIPEASDSNLNIQVSSSLDIQEVDYLSVSSLLESVQNVFQRSFPTDFKVCGIVRGLKFLGNGRVYLDLYDSDITASHLRSVIWESSAPHLAQLESEGFTLESELPVLVLGKLSFNQANGSISFVIKRIYPEYTKGKLAAQRDATNLKLKNEGLFGLNKEKHLVTLPKKLGLLTSKGGTVINDFLASLSQSEFGFELKWYPVRVQGQYALKDLIEGIRYFNKIKDLDAIVIFRGGGSVGDLQVFNEYELAKVICLSEKPILSAIGHEFDQSSTQDVSNLSFGVPKDLGHFLSRRVIDLRDSVSSYCDVIFKNSRDLVLKISNEIMHKTDQIRSVGSLLLKETYTYLLQSGLETLRKSSDILGKKEAYLQSSFVSIVRASGSVLEARKLTLKERAYNLISLGRYRCVDFTQIVFRNFTPLTGLSRRIFGDSTKLVENLDAIFKVVSPEMQLERGYAIIKNKSQILTGAKLLEVGAELDIQMKDGNIQAKVTKAIGV